MTGSGLDPELRSRPLWDDVLQQQIDAAHERILQQPEFLFEEWGGPVGAKAAIVVCRLFGFDDEHDGDWFTTEVLPEIRRPLGRGPLLVEKASVSTDLLAATYRPRSGWARFAVAGEMVHDLGGPTRLIDPATHQIDVLVTRYRRTV